MPLEQVDHAAQSSPFLFGSRALGVFLAFLSAFVPLSNSMYLPSLPSMAHEFQTTPEIISLSLSLFTLTYGLSMLFWGPLSDRFGRKPILVAGLLIYVSASVGLALCTSATQLILGRCVQAGASGAATSMALAVVKDSFRGRTMENMLSAVQSMTALAPVAAPVVGGQLLHFFHWRGIFWTLTGCGVAALLCLPALRETAPRNEGGQRSAMVFGRIKRVLSHGHFTLPLLVLSMSTMPFMVFLAVSSHIYEGFFGLSPQKFSFFFAANAMSSVISPILYLRFFRKLPSRTFLFGAFSAFIIFGILLLTLAPAGPLHFALIYIPITIATMAMRPPNTMLLMSQLQSDTGTVASLIASCGLLFGGLGMLLCSLPWPNFFVAAGVIAIVVGLTLTLSWLWLDRNRFYSGKKRKDKAQSTL